MLIRVAVCGLMAVARLIELCHSRRNIRSRGPSNESGLNRRIFPAIVAVHAMVIGGTLLFGRGQPKRFWLLLLLAAQPLRWWVLRTLGDRWNARGAVPESMPIATDGPYALVRHPNYSVVAVELAALPLAFGLDGLAIVASLANGALLAVRIREEEALLFELPGYREHFGAKPRFVPFVL